MQPAVGREKQMTGILMGAETIDQFGKSFILIVTDLSVNDPGIFGSLISARHLMEVDYKVNLQIPSDTLTDGFVRATSSPLWG